MAKNKIVFGNEVLIDLTEDTVTAADVVSGKVFHGADGVQSTGSLIVQTIYQGSSAPSSSVGVNGDIYIQS